jgi:hypothetical protein
MNIPFFTAVKETTFAVITVLEFPYPISVFCYSATFQVADDMNDRLNMFARTPFKIIENIMRRLGSILMNSMTAPDCLEELDGMCFGTKVGNAVNFVLYPY